MAIKEKIRVRLKSYDHTLIDTAAEKIVAVAKANGSDFSSEALDFQSAEEAVELGTSAVT